MKYTIDIHPLLTHVTFEADESFGDSLIKGEYASYRIELDADDVDRVEDFVIEHGNYIQDGYFEFTGMCRGYAMNLSFTRSKKPEGIISVQINTGRTYGQYGPIHQFDKDKVQVWMRKSVYDELKEKGELSKYIIVW